MVSNFSLSNKFNHAHLFTMNLSFRLRVSLLSSRGAEPRATATAATPGPPAARPLGLGAVGVAAVTGTQLTTYGQGQGAGQKVGTAQRSLMRQVITH